VIAEQLHVLTAEIQRLIELRGRIGITVFIFPGVNLIDSVLELSAEIKPSCNIGAGYYAIRINEGRGLFGDLDCSSGNGLTVFVHASAADSSIRGSRIRGLTNCTA
jgi:hypothetical protein